MGIRIRDILENEYFRRFEVIAGRAGLDRQFQGFAFLDAPDSLQWLRSREFVITSGYALSREPDCLERYMELPQFGDMAAFALKLRYLKKVPQKYIRYFDQYQIPLIVIPEDISWMEMMNQVQVMMMNRNIQQFRIHSMDSHFLEEGLYPARKLERILKAAEKEMKFPAFLYDVSTKKEYYSSHRFKKANPYPMRAEDFWQPAFSYSKQVMCPTLQMARYCLAEGQDATAFSWITVPIQVNGHIQAYFVLLESGKRMDYYDEFTVRVAILLLQAVYEQITATQAMSNQGFESFISYAIQKNEPERMELQQQANALQIKVQKKYCYALLSQKDTSLHFADYREELKNVFRKTLAEKEYRFAFLDENNCLLLFAAQEEDAPEPEKLQRDLLRCSTYLEMEIPAGRFAYSLYEEATPLLEVKRCLERCKRAMELGPLLYPKEKLWSYRKMGAFVWLNIPQDELEGSLREYLPMLQEEKNTEMFRTLKVYLESGMNYSMTAEKMYVHINTVRKRIDRAEQMLQINWENYMERLKLELLLHLMPF